MRIRCCQGFTLIELIAVLILTGILAAASVSYWPGLTINLASQAEQLAGDIRYVQSIASSHGQRTRINLASDRYWFSNLDNSIRIPHPVVGSSDVLLDSGIVLTSTLPYLVFSSDGVPYTNASLPGNRLTNDLVITLSSSGTVRAVRISPETGRVYVP